MAQYYKLNVTLDAEALESGVLSTQRIDVVVPTIGPAGPVGSVGPTGPQGPQGVPGTGLEVLTTQGDILYQGASTGQRLAIGTSGQILRVANGIPSWGNESGAVTSVNGETGAVSLSAADVGAAAAAHTHDGLDVFLTDDEAYGPVLAQSFAEGRNGIYWPTDLTINSKPVYKLNRTYGMFFENLRWHIFENSPLTANIVASSADDDESFPHQTTWSGGNVQRANVANFGTLASQQFQFVGDNLKVGTSSGLPLKTGSGGAVEAGSFGTSAGTFCEGNDARLSDARTPSSTLAHKASHATGGTDALAPSDIGAQSLLVTNNLTLTGNTTLTAGRNILWFLDAGGGASGTYQVTLPTTGNQAGDLIEIVVGFFPSGLIVDIYEDGALAENLYNVADAVPSKRRAYRNTNGTASGWIGVVPPFHNHSASQISSGTLDVAHLPVGTGSTQVAAGNHTHGNLTNAGAIGTTANLPLKTGTNGVVEAGSFGTAAGSFCAGDDVRLSDDRDPNAHAASHLPDGADEIFDQSLNTTDSVTFLNLHIDGGDLTGVGQLAFDSGAGQSVTISEAEISFTGAAAATTLTNIGAAASGSITSSGLTQSTARILGRTTASTGAVEEIQIGSGLSLSAGELSATGSGVTAVGASTADVLSVSGSDLVADDPNADRIVFWDDSESKLRYLEAGSGLSISGTTMTVTATGGATNLWIPASAWIPKTTAGCGVDSRETTTNDQNFDELLFDTGSDEFADALVVMPSNYNNGTITARFYWTAASGSGTVEWAIQGRAFANDDALDTAAGTKQAVNDTLIAANDMHITSATSACTIGGTPAANTPIQFTIYRDVSEDTLAVDARLLGVEIIFN